MPGSSKRQGFRVRVGAREHEVEISHAEDGGGGRRILVDGVAFEVASAGAHAHRVSSEASGDHRQIEVTLATAAGTGTGRATEAWVAGTRERLEVLTEQEARLAAALGQSSNGSGSGTLSAPMPGRVVKVLIVEGQAIEAGAPAIIVEAMKMENELHAPATGTVARVLVREGETVESGQPLCEITPPEPAEG
jgi:glutaconyl-CoA/methylmalonyl-CoA decarboxylase subunit gamma